METSPSPASHILPVLFLGVLMAALDIAIVGPALPAIREHFGLTERSIAWVFNAFVLFNLIGLPLMARLSDVYGRRFIYVVDVGLFALGSLTVALAPSFGVLLVGRCLQGAGASGIFPVASAVVGDVFPVERRGRALGLLGAVFGLAFIIGPMAAGILLLFGWRWLFVVTLPLAAVTLALALRRLPSGHGATPTALDGRGILTLCVMLGAMAYGLNQIDAGAMPASLGRLSVWPFLALAAALVPVFVAVERRAAAPVVRLQLFRSRQVIFAALLAVGAGLTEAAFVFFPALAVEAFAVTKSTASFMLLPLVGAIAVGSPAAGRLLDRTGSRTIVVASMVLLTLGLGLLGFYGTARVVFYAGSVLVGLGLAGVLGPSLSYILLNEARAAERTVAQGVITLSISVGQLMGGALIGAVAASGGEGGTGFLTAFLVIAGVSLALTGVATRLKGRAAERQMRRMPG